MAIGSLPIKTVVPPNDIAAIYKKTDSGKINLSLLTQVGPQGYLHHDAARAYRALAFMCLAIGLPLTYTYGGCYRPYEDQVKLFLQRYEKGKFAGRKQKTWLGQVYSLRPGMSDAATPGQSNHGWAIAVDFAFDSNIVDGIGPDDAATITSHPQWQTFKVYAQLCGFSWEDADEPWHLRLVTGSVPTQTVLNAEAVMYGGVIPPEDDDMRARAVQCNDGDPAIFAVTSVLTCYWMRAGVDTSLRALGLLETEPDGSAFEIARSTLKGLSYEGMLPNAGPTKESDFNICNGVPQQ